MKKIVILFLIIAINAQPTSNQTTTQTQQTYCPVSSKEALAMQQNQQNQQKPIDPDEETPYIVLQEFGKAVSHFANIVADPKNSKNVGANMTGIFGNIITVAAQMFKRSGKPQQEWEHELNQLEEVLQEILTDPLLSEQLFITINAEATRVKRSISCDA